MKARASDFWTKDEFMPIEAYALRQQNRCTMREPTNETAGHGYDEMHCGFGMPCPIHGHPIIMPRDPNCHMENCKGKYCGFPYAEIS